MISLHPTIAELPATAWDALAGEQPMLRHAFLDALEQSGCVGGDSGWTPCHLALWRDGVLCGAMPLYAKQHSYGEYVFDWAWARAYAEHGLSYYPKLLGAIPFTPLPGPRLLARTDADRQALIRGALDRAAQLDMSSLHLLFGDDADLAACDAVGLIRREQVQFHWQRQAGWQDFDDFLASLSRDKRRKIRQERRKIGEAGVRIERKAGHAIDAGDWAFFLRCYDSTYREHRSTPYLNLDFFLRAHAAQPEAWMMALAYRDDAPIAAALNLARRRLYGRYCAMGCRRLGAGPAFRIVLLPGHRTRAGHRAIGGRRWRAGRTQTGARLQPGHDPFGPLAGPPRLRRCRGPLPRPRTTPRQRLPRRTGSPPPVPPGAERRLNPTGRMGISTSYNLTASPSSNAG
uniref:GNAT family N-acetyltransferase n=1 Tax=Chitiniphilus eburneus TaxID=2571148 RepID=UPI004055ED78